MSTTASPAPPCPTNPRLVMHVGDGMELMREGYDKSAATTSVRMGITETTNNVIGVKVLRTAAFPLYLQSETSAAEAIIVEFKKCLQTTHEVYAVAIFSYGVFRAALAGLITAGCGDDILVVFHPRDGAPVELSWLQDGAYLVNWMFGKLEPFVEDEFLQSVDYSSLRTPLRLRK